MSAGRGVMRRSGASRRANAPVTVLALRRALALALLAEPVLARPAASLAPLVPLAPPVPPVPSAPPASPRASLPQRVRGERPATLPPAIRGASCPRSSPSGQDVATPERGSSPPSVSRAWPVMGTLLVITVWGRERADTARLLPLVHAARDSVRLVDSLMSNYRPASELSAINRAAGREAVPVSPQLLHVLHQARTYWHLSGGAFDPTVGPLVEAWGFHGTRGRIPPRHELERLRALVGFGAVEIDDQHATVRLPRTGMQLDLGGIAKGYALDLARAALRSPHITGGMIDLGGNILVFGQPPRGTKWRIGIRHPRIPGAILGTIAIDSGAVATSGDYEHFYTIGGVRYAHLIDPRTGEPARGVIAATAIAPRGEWSDGLSAALYLAGPSRGLPLADSLPGVGAIYVLDRGDQPITAVDLRCSRRAAQWFSTATESTPHPRRSTVR
jgi:thiamine biosynthesis lipoprotein